MTTPTFRKSKSDDSSYRVMACVVPHGPTYHFSTECAGGGCVGRVVPQTVQTVGQRGLVTERLWQPISGETGEALAVIGDAGDGLYFTRRAAADALVADARQRWQDR